jgi:hypothetical protein
MALRRGERFLHPYIPVSFLKTGIFLVGPKWTMFLPITKSMK